MTQLPDDDPDNGLGGYQSQHRVPEDYEPTPADIAVKRAAHAILLAVLDEECDKRIHNILCSTDTTPAFLIQVAHELAHYYVDSFGHGHEQMRADLIEDLHRLADG
jgi:hypothetical protein